MYVKTSKHNIFFIIGAASRIKLKLIYFAFMLQSSIKYSVFEITIIVSPIAYTIYINKYK